MTAVTIIESSWYVKHKRLASCYNQRMKHEANKITPIDRLNYSGNLDPVVNRLCDAYGVGDPVDFYVIDVGYEDCNVIVETKNEKYVGKIFSKGRTPQDITRYSTI